MVVWLVITPNMIVYITCIPDIFIQDQYIIKSQLSTMYNIFGNIQKDHIDF